MNLLQVLGAAAPSSTERPLGPMTLPAPLGSQPRPQASLMAPEMLPVRDYPVREEDILLGEVPLTPGDLSGLLKAAKHLSLGNPIRNFTNPINRGVPAEARFPKSGETTSGFRVGDKVDNTDSIPASVEDYETAGIRDIPLTHLVDPGTPQFVSKRSMDRARHLADEIQESRRIDPLIVVDNGQEFPYVLEGGHRIEALRQLLGRGEEITDVPALLVKELGVR